ncbi:MAG: dihydrofolate reductase [Gammaproteobacteria bacterium]|nr:dihydrofolate reductase [Gammaproteobacteria bacterium]
MRVSLVVAMAEDGVIGVDNRLPWRLSADLRHFRALTMGKPIIMGRRTHESIGKALPGRENIVLSRDSAYRAEGCTVKESLEAALAHTARAPEVMIIGGADVFAEALPIAERIYLTILYARFAGDTRFPDYDASEWREIEREDFPAADGAPCPYSFITLERISAAAADGSAR